MRRPYNLLWFQSPELIFIDSLPDLLRDFGDLLATIGIHGEAEYSPGPGFSTFRELLMKKILLFVSSVVLFTSLSDASADSKTFTIDDLLAIKRVSDPQLSPDGKWVAYTVGTPDLEKNKVINHIWLVSSTPGETPRQLTNGEKGESRPRWSPDGKWIAFTTSRSGSGQIWVLPIEGGEAWQLTNLSTGASDHVWSPTGNMLAFTSDVYPDCADDAANQKRTAEIEKSGIQAKTIDHLLYRHWNAWRDGKRSHLFVVNFDTKTKGTQIARDLTPGNFDVPPFSLGGPDAYAFSPDGKEIAYTRGADTSVEAWSTNADLFIMPVDGGTAKNLTVENKGWDGSPNYSPDGMLLSFRSQKRDGYESDHFSLGVYFRSNGTLQRMFSDKVSIEEIFWGPADGEAYFLTESQGRFSLQVGRLGKTSPHLNSSVLGEKNLSALSIGFPAGESRVVGLQSSLTKPAEIYLVSENESPALIQLTHHNDSLFSERERPSYESISYKGAKGDSVQAWLVKPPGFDPKKKYPFLYFIHGGPQGAWMDAFSYRWNPALFASQGYVVMLPNPRGSTGFGQKFTEEISGDWAGACYEDLMKGVDWAIAQGFVDPDRMGAAGGSFGGYMVNWILGHNTRFKALVSHAGVYNLESMYGTTEELWFPEWDLRGKPWEDGEENYKKFSPHRFAANFKTPTLVIHGELDYRVNVTEGMQLFTALQRQGIPSRFLYFPDEGHWILKPKNSRLWNETVLDWFDRFVKGKGGE